MHAFGEWLTRYLRENWLFLLLVGGIVGAFMFLRTTSSDVGSVAELDAMLQDGQPALVEFYSNT